MKHKHRIKLLILWSTSFLLGMTSPLLFLNQCGGGNSGDNPNDDPIFSLGNCDIVINDSITPISQNIDVLINNDSINFDDYEVNCSITEYSLGLMQSSINITNNTSINFNPSYYNLSSLPTYGSSFSFTVDATITDVKTTKVYHTNNDGYIYATDEATMCGTANGSNWYGMISGSVTVSFTGEAMNPSYCTITSSSSYKAENLSIPSKIWSSVAAMWVPLMKISQNAFLSCSGLTGSLTIPDGVKSIDGSAFSSCGKLTGDINIPNSVTSIGNNAFANCTSFDGNLTIGNSVTSIGNNAFYNCGKLIGNINIPNSVTSIGTYAFANCTSFDGNLTIGNSVTSIPYCAFSSCGKLTGDINIPNSVTSIDGYAFASCTSFNRNLTIGNSVTNIGAYAFAFCSALTGNVNIPNSVTGIGNQAFYYCTSLNGSLTIGTNVIEIGNSAFYGCWHLTGSLTIPNNVQIINNNAFRECSGFTVLNISNNSSTLGATSFDSCRNISQINLTNFSELPSAWFQNGDNAFRNISSTGVLTVTGTVNPSDVLQHLKQYCGLPSSASDNWTVSTTLTKNLSN